MKFKYAIILLFPVFLLIKPVKAQDLAFNIEAPQDIVVTPLNDGILNFGSVFPNDGLVQILLSDPEVEVLSIEGHFNKEVTVTLSPPNNLQLDANYSIPFTLRAAYANEGENDVNQAKNISGTSATFPIYDQESGGVLPPVRGGGGPLTATAYLYIYGDIDVGFVAAGTYSGTINITVTEN